MVRKSKIEWTEVTWNPWHGCKKVSEGCKYCYMYRGKEQYKQNPMIVQKSKTRFNAPLKWHIPTVIFTCSWSDFFIEEADEWRKEAWDIIRRTPYHTYQILTKRPHRALECLPEDWGEGYKNVWLGVSVENEARFWERVPQLRKIPAQTKFLSIEPLIERIEIEVSEMETIDWVIIGGESGNDNGKWKYRECKLEWIESIVRELSDTTIAVFVKQLGTHLSKQMGLKDRHGRNILEFPNHLRIRDYPRSKFKNV